MHLVIPISDSRETASARGIVMQDGAPVTNVSTYCANTGEVKLQQASPYGFDLTRRGLFP